VRATTLGKYFPFYVTANEVRCSEDMAARYNLRGGSGCTAAYRLRLAG
jgi:hypothetical protein